MDVAVGGSRVRGACAGLPAERARAADGRARAAPELPTGGRRDHAPAQRPCRAREDRRPRAGRGRRLAHAPGQRARRARSRDRTVGLRRARPPQSLHRRHHAVSACSRCSPSAWPSWAASHPASAAPSRDCSRRTVSCKVVRHGGGELLADCVVGADGVGSSVRSALGIRSFAGRPDPFVVGIGARPAQLGDCDALSTSAPATGTG